MDDTDLQLKLKLRAHDRHFWAGLAIVGVFFAAMNFAMPRTGWWLFYGAYILFLCVLSWLFNRRRTIARFKNEVSRESNSDQPA